MSATRFDEFSFRLWNLATGADYRLDPAHILNFQSRTVSGVGMDRLYSASFEIPNGTREADIIDFDGLQLLEVTRLSNAAWTLWGLISKASDEYNKRGLFENIKVLVVAVEELMKSRDVYHQVGGAITPIAGVNVRPDDFAKQLVRYAMLPGTCTPSKSGNSRDWNWDTLTVAADLGQCLELASPSILGGTVWDAVDKLAHRYDFDYQLQVTAVGGAFTFTFVTQAPYGGRDLTALPDRVIIRDLGGLVPTGRRYRDMFGRVNAPHTRGYEADLEDAASVAIWGRWEGVIDGSNLTDLEIALPEGQVKAGYETEFEATGLNGNWATWPGDFRAGDEAIHANARLGLPAGNEKIRAITFSFPDKVLKLEIEWGDREPRATDQLSGGRWFPPLNGVPPYPAYLVPGPISDDNREGTGNGMVREDHEHKGVISVGVIVVPPIAGVFTFTSTDGSITLTPNAVTGAVDFAAVVGAAGYWDRNAGDGTIFPGNNALLTDVVLINQNTIPVGAVASTMLDVNGHIRLSRYLYSKVNSLSIFGHDPGGTYLAVHIGDDGASGLPARLDVVDGGNVIRHRLNSSATAGQYSFLSGVTYFTDYTAPTALNFVKVDPADATPSFELWRGTDLEVYSGAGVTKVFDVDGATGTFVSAGNGTVTGGYLYLYDANSYIQRQTLVDRLRIATDRAALYFEPAGATHFVMNALTLRPATTDTETLGNTTFRFGAVWSVLGNFSGQITSTLAIGTAPFAVTSTTVCTNLNAGYVGGKAETAFLLVDGTRALSADWDAGGFGIRALTFQSDVATGTQPLSIASTTVCTNLNADFVDGFSAAQAATDGHIVVREADGDIAMKAGATVDGVDISAHPHNYDKPTQTGTWTVFGSTDWSSAPCADSGGVSQYVSASPNADGSGAAWKILRVGATPHRHANGAGDHAWSFTATATSAPV